MKNEVFHLIFSKALKFWWSSAFNYLYFTFVQFKKLHFWNCLCYRLVQLLTWTLVLELQTELFNNVPLAAVVHRLSPAAMGTAVAPKYHRQFSGFNTFPHSTQQMPHLFWHCDTQLCQNSRVPTHLSSWGASKASTLLLAGTSPKNGSMLTTALIMVLTKADFGRNLRTDMVLELVVWL